MEKHKVVTISDVQSLLQKESVFIEDRAVKKVIATIKTNPGASTDNNKNPNETILYEIKRKIEKVKRSQDSIKKRVDDLRNYNYFADPTTLEALSESRFLESDICIEAVKAHKIIDILVIDIINLVTIIADKMELCDKLSGANSNAGSSDDITEERNNVIERSKSTTEVWLQKYPEISRAADSIVKQKTESRVIEIEETLPFLLHQKQVEEIDLLIILFNKKKEFGIPLSGDDRNEIDEFINKLTNFIEADKKQLQDLRAKIENNQLARINLTQHMLDDPESSNEYLHERDKLELEFRDQRVSVSVSALEHEISIAENRLNLLNKLK